MDEIANIFTAPEYLFFRRAIAVGLLGSISFGIVGSYVVVRRMTPIAGALSHSILGGIGLSLYLKVVAHWEWLTPLLGSIISAIAIALLIGAITLIKTQRTDTVLNVIWSLGMALGLLFLAKTPGYHDLHSYLFGNIYLLSSRDLWAIAALDIGIVLTTALLYHQIQALCFEEEFTRLRGVPTTVYQILLLCLVALTIVLMINIVGILLVIALITLPAAVASRFSRSLAQLMLFSALLCALFTLSGLLLSFYFDLLSGPAIVVSASFIYFLSIALGVTRKKPA